MAQGEKKWVMQLMSQEKEEEEREATSPHSPSVFSIRKNNNIDHNQNINNLTHGPLKINNLSQYLSMERGERHIQW